MDKEKDTVIISAEEKLSECLGDSAGGKCTCGDRRPKGYVEIFERDENGEKKLISQSNLIVYVGREWAAQRLVDANNALATAANTKDFGIYWLGLGTGASSDSDPYTIEIPETLADSDLSTAIGIHQTDATNCADLQTGWYMKHKITSVSFSPDTDNSDKYLKTKLTTIIGEDDAIDSPYNLINEAGLYIASSGAGGHAGNFYLFAKITFPSITKTDTRELIIEWTIYT